MSEIDGARQPSIALRLADSRSLHVVIAVATYRRPEKLAVLLNYLERLELTRPALTTEILVVDNDDRCSAAPVVAAAESAMTVSLLSEPRRGVVHARNAALEAAIVRKADYLAFIDDDDYPDSAWLLRLLDTATTFAADLVTGPVVNVFDFDAPSWLATNERTRKGGEPVAEAYTCNLLIRLAALGQTRFDEAFNVTGGEDVEFTRRLIAGGANAVWSPRAVVYTPRIPAEAEFRRVARQTYRGCNIGTVARTKVEGGNVWLTVKGLLLMAWALITMPAAVWPTRSFHRTVLRFMSGAGIARGAIGWSNPGSWWEDN